ncbi:uncharacterized protein PV09_02967 [Verruconis gallopava]|uniref:Uncharacterized protein n=1 Tax=Verruconis gallopava TaxID=253628 RepID=A0A0D1XUW2_9PEZI|nr:uncharacterized protein PV09_02967 [Verruconis gallopava]KIW06536.1 hypothetical protein PV09_02967 [Verruconis gallopava]
MTTTISMTMTTATTTTMMMTMTISSMRLCALRATSSILSRPRRGPLRAYSSHEDPSRRKVVIVTGANRGIGKAMCDLILKDDSVAPLTLYATSRAGGDVGLAPRRRDQTVLCPRLDVADAASVAALAAQVRRAGEPVDVLINNAGVNLDAAFSLENARATLDTNYRGTLEMCLAFLPLLRNDAGRIVNMSSVGSSLKTWGPELAARVRRIDTLGDVEALVQSYLAHVQAGTDVEAGFPARRSYSVSKAAVNLLTKILAAQHPDATINCCCPGWIDTSMGSLINNGKTRPPKTPEQGARIPLRLAFGDVKGISGAYWANDSVRSKEDGKPQDW